MAHGTLTSFSLYSADLVAAGTFTYADHALSVGQYDCLVIATRSEHGVDATGQWYRHIVASMLTTSDALAWRVVI